MGRKAREKRERRRGGLPSAGDRVAKQQPRRDILSGAATRNAEAIRAMSELARMSQPEAAGIIKRRMAAEREPSDLSNWQPKGRYHVVDLGCGGDAERLAALAEAHPDKNFLGVDMVLERTERRGNLDLVKARAHEILPMLRDGSVSVANADYFLKDMPKETAAHVVRLLRPKLMRNGRLYVTQSRKDIKDARDLVGGDFVLEPLQSTVKRNLPMTRDGRRDFESMKAFQDFAQGKPAMIPIVAMTPENLERYKKHPELFEPMRFIARPKRSE
jgi:hypothetical protein